MVMSAVRREAPAGAMLVGQGYEGRVFTSLRSLVAETCRVRP
jgi:hypothetical protein